MSNNEYREKVYSFLDRTNPSKKGIFILVLWSLTTFILFKVLHVKEPVLILILPILVYFLPISTPKMNSIVFKSLIFKYYIHRMIILESEFLGSFLGKVCLFFAFWLFFFNPDSFYKPLFYIAWFLIILYIKLRNNVLDLGYLSDGLFINKVTDEDLEHC